MYDAAENDDFDREEVPTYEEVAKLYPRPGLYRPVVLIGPPGVGRNELKRRLMATDTEKYKTPVPCKLFYRVTERERVSKIFVFNLTMAESNVESKRQNRNYSTLVEPRTVLSAHR